MAGAAGGMQGVPGWMMELLLVGIASARFGFAFFKGNFVKVDPS